VRDDRLRVPFFCRPVVQRVPFIGVDGQAHSLRLPWKAADVLDVARLVMLDVQDKGKVAARRREVLERVRLEHPDLWRLSDEADVSLIDWMLEIPEPARLDTCRSAGRLWEAGRGPSESDR